jgi:hypothetical protein
VTQNEEEYRSAQELVEKYGADKVIHRTWPDNFMAEQEQMVRLVGQIADDPDVHALIINQAVPGTIAAIDKLLETRDDIFIACATPQENPPDIAPRAHLISMPDELAMGPAMVIQAKKLGAEYFVHYSFPRHMAQPLLSGRRELMREKCAELGIEFVDATAPDPTSDVGIPGAQQFILEDVPKMVAKYGKNTAFFSTNCAMQIPLIKATSDEGGIYPQPCCPSPYHGYPLALGLISAEGEDMGSVPYVIEQTTKALAEKGVLGRFSTWPVPASMMNTNAMAEYSIKWINGEVPQTKGVIDLPVLAQCMKDYSGVDIDLSTYDEEDGQFDNFIFMLMGYLTYGE